MAKKHDLPKKKADAQQASTAIAIGSVIGLTICVVSSQTQNVAVPLYLYAIFGGGILGTDNILKLLRSIFRIDR
jgi:hypothetical protein